MSDQSNLIIINGKAEEGYIEKHVPIVLALKSRAPYMYSCVSSSHEVATYKAIVFIRIEAHALISYKRFLTQRLYEPFLYIT